MQLVQDQHQQLLGRVGMNSHELRIDQHPRNGHAFDRGGRNLGRLDNVHQPQQGPHGAVATGKTVEKLVFESSGLGTGCFRINHGFARWPGRF